MLRRQELIGTRNNPDKKHVYDCLVDAAEDLTTLTYMGEGSLAYVRAENAVYVKTAESWEVV